MTTTVQNNSCGFVNWCQNETNNLKARCPDSCTLLELVRRILVISSLIIPLIGILANCTSSRSIQATQIQAQSLQNPLPLPGGVQRQNLVPLQGKLKERMQLVTPRLYNLVESVQQGRNVTQAEYNEAFRTILVDELGINENRAVRIMPIDGSVVPNAFAFRDLLTAIRNKLELEESIFLPGEASPESAVPFACYLKNDLDETLAIARQGQYWPLAKYASTGERVTKSSNQISELTQDDIDQAAESVEVKIDQNMETNKRFFHGTLPNVEAYGLEKCVELLAYLLPTNVRTQPARPALVVATVPNPAPRLTPLAAPIIPVVQAAPAPPVAAVVPQPIAATVVTIPHAIKAMLENQSPELASLIADYQSGVEIPVAKYEAYYPKIMIDYLGYSEDEIYNIHPLNGSKTIKPFDTTEAFMRLREKMGLEGKVFLDEPYDFDVPETVKPFGYFLRGQGHNSFAAKIGNQYKTCTEYLVNGPGRPHMKGVESQTFNSAEEIPGFGTEGCMGIRVSQDIPSARGLFTGKLPNLNSCAMESCIFLLSYLLPR